MTGRLCDLSILRESCWFQAHTLAMAECCLLFFVLGTKHKDTTEQELASAYRAHDLLGILAQSSNAARISRTSLSELLQSTQG